RTFEHHFTLIGYLVGVTIASQAMDVLEEFIQQPDAPNLFWALTDLPSPLISMRNSMAGERVWVGKDFDVLGKPDPIPDADLKRIAKLLTQIIFQEKKMTAEEWYQKQYPDEKAKQDATDRLAKLGFPKEKLSKFSPFQLAMADDF